MGVPGLWKILEPAGREMPLLELSLQEGFMKKPNHQLYRIGIDVSLWFFNTLATHSTENHELQLIFFRMARFLRHPCQVLFVFDGPGRPLIKRGHTRSQNFHWLEESTKKLADAFGFAWIQAPGEAEAELAHLNCIGKIDAVLSEDVDSLIFGAKTVLRSASGKSSGAQFDHVVIYDADNLHAKDGLHLSQSDLVMMALLVGGDYDEAGLEGCGTSIALGLVRTGLGKRLSNTASLPDDRRQASITLWREELATELATNASKFLNRTYPAIAASLRRDSSFPNLTTLDLYLNPLSSKVQLPNSAPLDAQAYSMPNVSEIASCCELYFQWGSEQAIIDRFQSLLFDAISLHSLIASSLSMDWPSVLLPGALIRTLERSRLHKGTLTALIDYRAQIDPTEIIRLLKSGIKGIRKPSASPARTPKPKSRCQVVRVWLPGPLVRAALPTMLAKFLQKKPPQKKKTVASNQPKRPTSRGPMRSQENATGNSASQRRPDRLELQHSPEGMTIYISSDEESGPGERGLDHKLEAVDVIDLTNSDSDSE